MNYRDRIAQHQTPLQGTLYRVVESQEDIATTRLVDNTQEQIRLEELLEDNKPARVPGTEGLHYLLATPFRYPPLKYGSRFGRSFEPSLFYGAMTIDTALAETAFYRFVFLSHVETPFPEPLTTLHTVFSARIRTDAGIRLQDSAWQDLHRTLTDPANYRESQALGSDMRHAGIQAFQYLSARALQAGLYSLPYNNESGLEGINGALFTPTPFQDTQPRSRQRLIVVAGEDTVSMSLTLENGSKRGLMFSRECFLVDGTLAEPAP